MSISAIQNYSNAARLAKPGGTVDTFVEQKSTETSTSSFKNEFSGIGQLFQGVKQSGGATEMAVGHQIMGGGSIEQTALALNDLNTRLELLSQFLKMGIDKIDQLTSKTMGG